MRSKALILLFIFLLNTITGFSCALHMSGADTSAETTHEHGGHAKEHHRSPVKINEIQKTTSGPQLSSDDPCCQGAVNNFIALAKLIPASDHTALSIPFIGLLFDDQFYLTPPPRLDRINSFILKERRGPPGVEILIKIRRFQI